MAREFSQVFDNPVLAQTKELIAALLRKKAELETLKNRRLPKGK